jgi:hypothetical protein
MMDPVNAATRSYLNRQSVAVNGKNARRQQQRTRAPDVTIATHATLATTSQQRPAIGWMVCRVDSLMLRYTRYA